MPRWQLRQKQITIVTIINLWPLKIVTTFHQDPFFISPASLPSKIIFLTCLLWSKKLGVLQASMENIFPPSCPTASTASSFVEGISLRTSHSWCLPRMRCFHWAIRFWWANPLFLGSWNLPSMKGIKTPYMYIYIYVHKYIYYIYIVYIISLSPWRQSVLYSSNLVSGVEVERDARV